MYVAVVEGKTYKRMKERKEGARRKPDYLAELCNYLAGLCNYLADHLKLQKNAMVSQKVKTAADAHVAGHHFFFQRVVHKIRCFWLETNGERHTQNALEARDDFVKRLHATVR